MELMFEEALRQVLKFTVWEEQRKGDRGGVVTAARQVVFTSVDVWALVP